MTINNALRLKHKVFQKKLTRYYLQTKLPDIKQDMNLRNDYQMNKNWIETRTSLHHSYRAEIATILLGASNQQTINLSAIKECN